MRTVESNTPPHTLERIQGKTLVNVLITELTPESYEYQQIEAPSSATAQEALLEVQKAFSARMEMKEREGARAMRAILLSQGTPEDTLKLEEIDALCLTYRTELARLTTLLGA